MGRLDGTVALISGGARGMGESHARALVSEGAQVVIGDILQEEGEAVASDLGESCRFCHLDVTSADDWSTAVREAEEAFGPVSLLVNNAGILSFGPIESTEPDEFRRVLEINLVGVFLGMHTVVPSLRRAGGGTIINVSSTAGLMGIPGLGAYVASKWGVRGLTKTAAMELGRDGIRVVSIHPGGIRTPMTEEMSDDTVATQPIPRFGTPEEVSKLVLFIAADATYSTGCEFIVDGGQVAGPVLDLQEG